MSTWIIIAVSFTDKIKDEHVAASGKVGNYFTVPRTGILTAIAT